MKHLKFSVGARALAAAAALLAMGVAQAGSSVQLVAPAAVSPGDSFAVAVNGADFVPIIGGGLDFSFSAGLLELLSAEVAPAWNFMPVSGVIDNTSGTLVGLSFNIFGFPPLSQSGDFAIATLQFKAKAPGLAAIDVAVSPDWPFATPAAEVPAFTLSGASVQIGTPVPEPAAWLLMLGGLGLLGLRMGRRSA